jgi:hypothetical protein
VVTVPVPPARVTTTASEDPVGGLAITNSSTYPAVPAAEWTFAFDVIETPL